MGYKGGEEEMNKMVKRALQLAWKYKTAEEMDDKEAIETAVTEMEENNELGENYEYLELVEECYGYIPIQEYVA